MFGYIQINAKDLPREEKQRYNSLYCGLCHVLGAKYGISAKRNLSYDLTFVILLLGSLYEPPEETGKKYCAMHPYKRIDYTTNPYTEYCADMTLLLAYFNCLDDWKDEHKQMRKRYADKLKGTCEQIREKWPVQCAQIEAALEQLAEIEEKNEPNPDAAANCSGRLLKAVFSLNEDHWAPPLRRIGFGLGKFIYLADAACDFERDKKTGNYNPLVLYGEHPAAIRPALMQILGGVSETFEALPLIQDAHILRNILYSGVWLKYNSAVAKSGKGAEHDQ